MGKPSLISEEDLKETSNLLPMRSDIHELWDSNSFSVDVDDEYRIRIFNQDALKAELPPRLKTVPTDKYMNAYLRIHFRQTLIVGLLGGDISYDHSPREVKRMTKALLNPESGENHVPFDDDRWKTDIGKEIFRYNFEETSQLETEAP
ncbi:hypothetical protein EVJ58_g10101 [Rhodofomes roseus]|uniref:HNH nuclease domain-containing protein n=1 Tax=Rhodofomes roseus TaxID=34475 RepID=A0A4Y9XRA6_9APHY|nr:hypothetical protein EVJ58_g10101 [Rhodofomes roseus]